jgi:hypothetical protein
MWNLNLLIYFKNFYNNDIFTDILNIQKKQLNFLKFITNFQIFTIHKKQKKYTIIKSPFVHKKKKEQYNIITFKKNILVNYNNTSLVYFLAICCLNNWKSSLIIILKHNYLIKVIVF